MGLVAIVTEPPDKFIVTLWRMCLKLVSLKKWRPLCGVMVCLKAVWYDGVCEAQYEVVIGQSAYTREW